MKINVYANLSPEHMYEAGIKAGLNEEAANFFRYLNELEIELHVDAENGAICGGKILTQFEG